MLPARRPPVAGERMYPIDHATDIVVKVDVNLFLSAAVTIYAVPEGPPSQKPHMIMPGIISTQFRANEKISGAGNHAIQPAIIIFFLSYRSERVPDTRSVVAASRLVTAYSMPI